MNIIIDKTIVYAEVEDITGYTGKNSGDVDKISATEDELNILDRYWDDAISNAFNIIRRYSTMTDDTSKVTYALTLPPNFNSGAEVPLNKNMRQYIVNFICAKWFNLVKPEEVKTYDALCINIASNISKLIMERTKPVRR